VAYPAWRIAADLGISAACEPHAPTLWGLQNQQAGQAVIDLTSLVAQESSWRAGIVALAVGREAPHQPLPPP
jgi:hypothetical protein